MDLCILQVDRDDIVKNKKTNAARILDSLHIDYSIMEYDKNGVLMACIPGDGTLDLKALAAVSGNKRVELVPLKEVLGLTGYVRGGCSPLGAKKNYPVYLDESSGKYEHISISAGKRGEQIILAPGDLVQAVNAIVAKLIR